MNDFPTGIMIGATIAAIVLIPMILDREKRITNLLNELDELEEARERDNFFAEQEDNLELAVAKAKRRF